MNNILTTQRLISTISALAPTIDISIGTFGDSNSIRIGFQPTATQTQITNAQNALASFDWSDAATQAWLTAQQNPNLTALLTSAATAISNNQTFLNLASPTNAQAIAQVQALTNQINKIIKILANILT